MLEEVLIIGLRYKARKTYTKGPGWSSGGLSAIANRSILLESKC
jgi:hypothetical protein